MYLSENVTRYVAELYLSLCLLRVINQEKQRIGKEIMEDYFQFLNHIDDVALEQVPEYL
ncbi:hypothetical protein L950_0204990 [Sphingobacterium sp. IITKGP-BTPF85]|nr:hypothetical protein L950_0204990 [Sphingobacterium sp. IITKGP-BTPF85]